MKFTIGDYVMSLVCLVCIGLGVFGGIIAGPIPAKIASFGAASAFLAGIIILIVWRHKSPKHDYKTKFGLMVRLGKKNRPSRTQVTAWMNELYAIWYPVYQSPLDLSDKFVVFVDKEKISAFGKFFRGFTWGNTAVVGMKKDESTDQYTYSLFRHEVSHLILDVYGEKWDEEHHHRLMKEAKV